MMRWFTKQADFPEREPQTEQVIQEQLAFVCAPDEQRFTRCLLTRLLDEGCNLPVRIAKPYFYDLMQTGLLATLSEELQHEFAEHGVTVPCRQYAQFLQAIDFYRTHTTEQVIALQVTESIEQLVGFWQIQGSDFQEEREQFEARLQRLLLQLRPEGCAESDSIPVPLARRRLYLVLATSLARYLPDRQALQAAFGSLPELIQTMPRDHAVFYRFMAFCQKFIPYFSHVASQIVWRTLETLQLETETESRKQNR